MTSNDAQKIVNIVLKTFIDQNSIWGTFAERQFDFLFQLEDTTILLE